MVVCACNPGTQEEKAEVLQWVNSHPGLCSNTLILKIK